MLNKENPKIIYLKNVFTIIGSGSMPIFWVTFASSIVLTLFIWHTIKVNIYNTAESDFNNLINDTETAITKRIMTYELVLKGTVGLFNSSEDVSRDEWKNYIGSLNFGNNYKGMLGIGFIEQIKFEDLGSHISKMRAEGMKNYKIFPLSKFKIYAPIIYFEPYNLINKKLIGYDMYTDSLRKNIMLYVRDSAEASITTNMRLLQDSSQNYGTGFLMFEPIYKKSSPTLGLRRKNFLGYIYSPIRMSDFINSILTKDMSQISLEIFDGTNTNKLLYSDSIRLAKYHKAPLFTGKRIINVNNHSWLLVFNSLPAFENKIEVERPYYFLIAGLAFSILIFSLFITVSYIRYNSIRLKQILSTTTEGIYGVDLNYKCTFINNAACNILGFNQNELLNNKIHDIIHYKKENNETYSIEECPITLCLKESKPAFIDNEVFWKKDGTAISVEYSSSPIIKSNNVTGAVVTFRDITEKKNFIEKLENSIDEKTILLKEVHHRVKNNLQIISSLLNLQALQIRDEDIRAIFKESQNRVLSMALIHEKLYQTDNMSHISFTGYLNELVQNIYRSYSIVDKSIDFDLKLEEADVNIDASITLGLIVNEIVSNSLKHAFKGRSNGTISIELTTNKEMLILKIKDNGIGIPADFNYKNTTTLGFNIILNLVDQINGKLSINTENGTEMIIEFPDTLT
jgi:PAS domain S-box-containing protein